MGTWFQRVLDLITKCTDTTPEQPSWNKIPAVIPSKALQAASTNASPFPPTPASAQALLEYSNYKKKN